MLESALRYKLRHPCNMSGALHRFLIFFDTGSPCQPLARTAKYCLEVPARSCCIPIPALRSSDDLYHMRTAILAEAIDRRLGYR